MSKKLSTVHIEAVVYSKNTNGDYILDTNEHKIILKHGRAIVPTDDYEFKITITDY